MELGREGHSGLYTMHFSNLFPCDASASPPSGKSEASSSPPCSLTQFSQWHVLLRMNVENEICFVKGEAKIFSPTPSLASPSARGMQRSGETCSKPVAADGIPIIPIFQKDRRCNVLIEGTYRQLDGSPESTGASTFRLEVHFGRLEAAVLGLSEPEDLHDVVLSCGGYKSCGWHMGTASVMVGGTPIQTPQKLRFLLKPYYGKRCTNCLDPVYAIGYGCKDCQATSYCSRECLNAHMRRGHGLLCPVLKERYGTQSVAVATEVSDDTGLVGWWRCLPNAQYSILVDGGNSLGCAIEFTLCTLRSAKEDGLHYRFILDKDAAAAAANNNSNNNKSGTNNNNNNNNLPSHESVIDFSCVLLREVNRSAILEGCVSMAAACLNYLYVFSPSAEITVQAHVQFFTAFHCEELDGPISTMEEYVSYARPLHALAALQIEYALKSPIAAEFWRRIKIAKDVIMALFTVNASGPCAGIEAMKDVILTQHCETLTMLSKVFVMMATRAPQEESRKWLDQAEKCLRQFIQNEGTRQSDGLQAIFLFRLSAVLLLYQEPEKSEEAVRLRQQGEALLRAGKLAQESGTEADEHAHATTISAKA